MMKQGIDNIKTDNTDKPLADAPGKNEKPLREVSVEGCELLGKGGNGAVYRLDDETIIKVYFGERNSFDNIRKSRERTRDAFVHGVPSMIAFDMVRVGDNYGVVYEMINAKSMNQVIAENPDRIDEYACLIADTLKKLHHTEFEEGQLQDARERYKNDVMATLNAGMYKPSEAERLFKLIDDIPYRNTFIHQDFHPGNMMFQNGEIMLIDLDDAGIGHPVLDLASMYLVYVTAAKTNWKTTNQGINPKQYARLWDIIVRRYFETDSPRNIQEINRILKGYSMIKFIRGVATSPSVPGFLRRPVVGMTKRKLMAAVDSLHPIP
ncbi:MAG: phosphotransferase [Oscillospiraceae bacterium]|nr:phosphotransferase [Oscillospiraceae bacterium]